MQILIFNYQQFLFETFFCKDDSQKPNPNLIYVNLKKKLTRTSQVEYEKSHNIFGVKTTFICGYNIIYLVLYQHIFVGYKIIYLEL